MGFLRSEEVLHKKIRMPGNIPKAVKIMDIIGKFEEDALQFIDLTANDIEAKNNFFPLINRCNEMEKQLSSFEQFAKDFGLNVETYNNYEFIIDLERDQNNKKLSNEEYFDSIEQEISDGYNKMRELIESYNKIKNDLIYYNFLLFLVLLYQNIHHWKFDYLNEFEMYLLIFYHFDLFLNHL